VLAAEPSALLTKIGLESLSQQKVSPWCFVSCHFQHYEFQVRSMVPATRKFQMLASFRLRPSCLLLDD
jgi:hypothetical protein